MATFAIIAIVIQLCACLPFDDPTKWPGHLESFGSKQKTADVNVYYEWPSAKDFFEKFVDKSTPGLFKGVNKHSKAVHLWNDRYFREHKSTVDLPVGIEGNLKENRNGEKWHMPFSEFVETYRKKPILMFSTIPFHLMKDIVMPSPLICNETSKYFVNAMGMMSQGGSKSVVCNEDVETIFCPIQGITDVLLVEYTQNKNYVIDRPEGGYSTLDVDKVDYVKYPNLRKIDQYFKASLEEGDCLYIPYRWYKQMNGHANHDGRNIALNIWFQHLHDHKPVSCDMSPHDATLDKFRYSDLLEMGIYSEKGINITNLKDDISGKHENDEEDEVEQRNFMKHFYQYFKELRKKNITFDEFYHLLKKDEQLTHQIHEDLEFPETFKILAVELFQKFDLDNDRRIDVKEFKKIVKNGTMLTRLSSYLEYQVARIEDYVEDLVEAKHHDEPLHVFEERMKEKFRMARKFEL